MNNKKIRILILGVSGMLGSTIFRVLSKHPAFDTYGVARNRNILQYFTSDLSQSIITDINLDSEAKFLEVLNYSKPDIIINCVGIIKQLTISSDYLENISINSILPHRLAKYSELIGARLIHFSTDCVFSGRVGQYQEKDTPDACDLYGRTKLLGEISYKHTITLRTSIIGHELTRKKSLVDWFLGESKKIEGYKNAIFSGLTTLEIAKLLQDLVIPNPDLTGLYHLSVDPINKFDLLTLISKQYAKQIDIIPNYEFEIDRSLNSDKFCLQTGFKPKSWPELIREMHYDYVTNYSFQKK